MLKKSAGSVLASFRPSTQPKARFNVRHCRRTVSPASTDALIVLRAVDLAAALLDAFLGILQKCSPVVARSAY
jgi:hypothetical protein